MIIGVPLFVSPWTVARQAPLPMEFSRTNTGVGCHFLARGSTWPRDRTHVCGIAGNSLAIEPPGMVVETKLQGPRGEREERKWLLTYQEFSSQAFFIEWIGSKNFFFPTKKTNGLFSRKNVGKTQEHLFSWGVTWAAWQASPHLQQS